MRAGSFDFAELYEAVLDDDHFAAVPGLLAQNFGARSATIHWLVTRDRSVVAGHSGYFTDAQMTDYANNYVAHDVWTHAAVAPGKRNVAWDVEELVASNDYERSPFYTDWIRGMGDDTYRCIGAVMETRHGLGIIGLHRGRSQATFSDRTVASLDKALPHLRRALSIRGAIAARAGELAGWEQLFALSPAPCLVIHADGRLIQANAAGDAALATAAMVGQRGNRLLPYEPRQIAQWNILRARATDAAQPQACQGAFGHSPDGLWLAEFVPLVAGRFAACAMVTLIDRSTRGLRPEPAAALRDLYGLTPAEAEVALALAADQSLADIAAARATSTGTVKTQIKQVLAKTGARRQSELVGIVLRLSLP